MADTKKSDAQEREPTEKEIEAARAILARATAAETRERYRQHLDQRAQFQPIEDLLLAAEFRESIEAIRSEVGKLPADSEFGRYAALLCEVAERGIRNAEQARAGDEALAAAAGAVQ